MDKVSKELGRVGQATQQLQITDQSTQDKLTVMEESKRMVDTKFDALGADLLATKEAGRLLQEHIERRGNEDLRTLKKELANTNLIVNQAVSEQKAAAAHGRENRDGLRDTRVDIEKVLNEVKKANTVTNILENRLASTAKGLQQSWSKCAELSDTMVKLAECYDKTKARVIDNEGQIKEINNQGKEARDDIMQAQRNIEQNTDRISLMSKMLNEEVASTEDIRSQVNGLKQSTANVTRQVTTVKSEISEVKVNMSSMRGAIKSGEGSMLPHMDSQEASSTSLRQSSMMTSSSMGGTAGRPTSQRGGQTPRDKGQKGWG